MRDCSLGIVEIGRLRVGVAGGPLDVGNYAEIEFVGITLRRIVADSADIDPVLSS